MKTKIFSFILALTVFAFSPLYFAGALNSTTNTGLCPTGWTTNSAGVCVNAAQTGPKTAGDLILVVINVLLAFAALVAILFIVLGGYKYMISGVNEKQAEEGKKTVTNAIIGLVIIILAFVIVAVVNNTAGQVGSTGVCIGSFCL